MTTGRDAIGRGLEPARAARPVEPGERIHVVGVAGAGASAAALLGQAAGALVTGCDPGAPSPYTAALAERGIRLEAAHDPRHVTDAPEGRPSRLAVTKALTAIRPDHPELAAAREAGVPAFGGLGMLIHQAALSFEIWTGQVPSSSVMSAAALATIAEPPMEPGPAY